MRTAQFIKNRILKSTQAFPEGESVKTEYILTSNGKDHYEGLVFDSVESAQSMSLIIKHKRNVDVKIKPVKRLIYRDSLWKQNEYIEIKTIKGVEK